MGRTPARRCAICGDALPPGSKANRLTCSPAHAKQLQRAKQRALKREQAARDRAVGRSDVDHAPNSDVVDIVRRDAEDTARETLKEELRPVIREALDADVMRAIRDMIGLAPAAVAALKDDLDGDDPMARSRAAQMVVKYTLGNPNVTPPRPDANSAQLTIINQLPDAPAPFIDAELEDAPSGDLKRCDTCRLDKPVEAFPAGGPRCADCLESRKQAVLDAVLRKEQPAAAPPVRAGDALAFQGPKLDRLPSAPEQFPGPPDPHRFSNG